MNIQKNLLLIAGTGQNTGKTTLASAIIQHFKTRHQIIGIKISSHLHSSISSENALIKNPNWTLFKETNKNTGKDSSKMLDAGASMVFYLEVIDEYLTIAFESLIKIIPDNSLLVCESPALRKHKIPSVFFIVDHPNQTNKKQDVIEMVPLADYYIDTKKMHVNQLIPGLRIKNDTWQFNAGKIVSI